MNKDILICGVGGQGTVLASRIIAAAAMAEGNTVHSAETIGMAQRGGPVTSHIRIGEEVFSPLIPFGRADLMIGFEPSEAVRNIKYLSPGGAAVVNTCPVMPVDGDGYIAEDMTEYLKKHGGCIFANGTEECKRLGSARFLNILLLGIAAGSGHLGLSKDTMMDEIAQRVPGKFREANIQAFLRGVELAG